MTQRHDDESDDESYSDMPGLQTRYTEDSSSDDDSLSYQRDFENNDINDLGETAIATINKVEHDFENIADTPDEITVGQDENQKLAKNDLDFYKGR
jgi:hypothetical protein